MPHCILCLIQWKAHNSLHPPPAFFPWESDINRPRPCQVQSSLIPCMLKRLNRAEAAGPPVSESTGFAEERQWPPVLRLSAHHWSFCIPKEPRIPLNLTSCLPCVPERCCAWAEKRNPVFFKAQAFIASSVAFWGFTRCWLANSESGRVWGPEGLYNKSRVAGSPWMAAG